MRPSAGCIGEGRNAREALPRKRKHNNGKSGRRKKQTTEGLGSGKFLGVSSNIPRGFVAGDRVFVRLQDTEKEKYSDIGAGGYVE